MPPPEHVTCLLTCLGLELRRGHEDDCGDDDEEGRGVSVKVREGVHSVTGRRKGWKEGEGGGGGAAFRKRRRTYLTLQPCQREQNTEESRG